MADKKAADIGAKIAGWAGFTGRSRRASMAARPAVMRLAHTGAVVQVAVALAIALVVAPLVSSATSFMDDTAGRVWPFSLACCPPLAASECPAQPARTAAAARPLHIRTGSL